MTVKKNITERIHGTMGITKILKYDGLEDQMIMHQMITDHTEG